MKKRIAAEWEPALGAMIAWPLALPHEIVAEYAKDDRVWILVENEEEAVNASEYLSAYIADMSHVSFLTVPRGYDGSWPRDWGPHPVFDENGCFSLGCPQYRFSTPNATVENDSILYDPYTELFQESMEAMGLGSDETLGQPLTEESETLTPMENDAAPAIAAGLGFDSFKMPIVFTGGNIMSDGRGTLISCAALVQENRLLGYSEEAFRAYAAVGLGANAYYILSNYEDFGIQHVDCLLKMVDEETLIIARPPEDHPLHDRYERIVNEEISRMRTCYGRPYRIFRVDTARFHEDELTAYANSYILNRKVFVPMYGIEQDAIALEQWRTAMPGYEVLGFTYNYADRPAAENLGIYETVTGWAAFDVIHCRTRSVWDPEMLYVSLERVPAEGISDEGCRTYAQIVDYSGKGLAGTPKAFWRVSGESDWHEEALVPTPSPEQWQVNLPVAPAGSALEYYISAESASGRAECAPRVAPAGFYTLQF